MKRLSNKKLFWEPILFGTSVVVLVFLFCTLVFLFFAQPASGNQEHPFCKEWNEMGEDPTGNEPATPAQRKMFHLGYWLTKSDFVRTTLNEHYGQDNLLVDRAVTCYEEHVIYLVEQVDEICKCSIDDKQDKVFKAFNDYINDCVREANRSK